MKKQEQTEIDILLLESEAEAAGLTFEQYLEFTKLKTENAKLKKSKAAKALTASFFFFIAAMLTAGVFSFWIYAFKPYYRYDKVVQGSSSYMVRTNLTTGKTEKFNNLTLEWEDSEILEAKKQSQPQNTRPWTVEDVARERAKRGISK